MCVCMYVYMYICILCMYVCMYVCVYVCVYVCMYVSYPNLPWNYSSYSAFEVINDSQQQRKKFNEVWKDYLLYTLRTNLGVQARVCVCNHYIVARSFKIQYETCILTCVRYMDEYNLHIILCKGFCVETVRGDFSLRFGF